MLKNLGYKKVTAIFDGDKRIEYERCKTNFTDYNIKILSKDDIRDKNAINRAAKTGITSIDGKIKEENKEYFLQLLNEINIYHSN